VTSARQQRDEARAVPFARWRSRRRPQSLPRATTAREALHAAIVGHAVHSVLEYKGAALGGRLMARVHVKRACDVVAFAETPASSGLVRVRRPADLAEDCAAAYDSLCSAGNAAVAARAGIHGDVAAIISVRCLATRAVNPAAVADANKNGAPLDGIVEYVANGSVCNAFVKNQPGGGGGERLVTLCLSGVQCQGFRSSDVSDGAMPFAIRPQRKVPLRNTPIGI
jgi:hypothetical protein